MKRNMEMRPQYKVIVSDRARQMLASHVLFLAQKSPVSTRKVKSELMIVTGTGLVNLFLVIRA